MPDVRYLTDAQINNIKSRYIVQGKANTEITKLSMMSTQPT